MKVNEKIQYYRKRAGLSQEELGKRLLVSRQTVSLWETGQTLPTLDNLTRLKDIFGVSIDELLYEDDENAPNTPEDLVLDPFETYNFRYSADDLKKIYKSVFVPNLVLALVMLGAVIAGFIQVMLMPRPHFEHGFYLGCFIMASIVFSLLPINALKEYRSTRRERAETDYTLKVYGDKFVYESRRNGILQDLKTVFFDKIKTVTRGKEFLCIYAGNLIFSFKHESLVQSSILYSVSGRNKKHSDAPAGIKAAALVFFVLSLISIFAFPLSVISIMYSSVALAWCVASICLLISALSIIFGVLLCMKGRGGIKSIISGIVSLLLVIAVSFLFIGEARYSPIEDAEYYADVDIPDEYEGMSLDVVEDFIGTAYVYYRAEYYFDDKAVPDFELKIKKDSRWLTADKAKELLALCPENTSYQGADYYLFYEYTTDGINYLPENGEYVSYLLIAYFADENLMAISEYDCNNE